LKIHSKSDVLHTPSVVEIYLKMTIMLFQQRLSPFLSVSSVMQMRTVSGSLKWNSPNLNPLD